MTDRRNPSLGLLLLATLLALPAAARPLKGASRSRASLGEGEPSGKPTETEIGIYLTPLFGFETNYKLLPPRLAEQPESAEVEGSAMVAVEGGMELIHQRTGSLRLRAELAGLARLPLANTRMVEAVAGLPVLLFYRLGPRVELFVSNLLGYERARTPPLFVPEDLALASPGKPILYDALHEALRSAVSLEPVRIVRLELGAYARAKTVTFYASDEEAGQDEEIADYWLYDLGLDLGATVQISPSFSARLRYDLAHRGFPGEGNLPARKSNFLPVGSGTNLTMLRQLAGLYLRGRVADLISARVSYGVRLVHDNGGYYECTDHLVGLGMEASWPDLLNITMGATLLLRNYTRRDVKGYSSSKPTSEGDMSVQIQEELSLVGHLRGELTVTEWLQVVLLYEVEVGDADVMDLTQNHRLLGGVTFFL